MHAAGTLVRFRPLPNPIAGLSQRRLCTLETTADRPRVLAVPQRVVPQRGRVQARGSGSHSWMIRQPQFNGVGAAAPIPDANSPMSSTTASKVAASSADPRAMSLSASFAVA